MNTDRNNIIRPALKSLLENLTTVVLPAIPLYYSDPGTLSFNLRKAKSSLSFKIAFPYLLSSHSVFHKAFTSWASKSSWDFQSWVTVCSFPAALQSPIEYQRKKGAQPWWGPSLLGFPKPAPGPTPPSPWAPRSPPKGSSYNPPLPPLKISTSNGSPGFDYHQAGDKFEASQGKWWPITSTLMRAQPLFLLHKVASFYADCFSRKSPLNSF